MTISFLEKRNNNYKLIIFPIFYVNNNAFLIDENSTGGAYQDYTAYKGIMIYSSMILWNIAVI